jgi:hypothetical protein
MKACLGKEATIRTGQEKMGAEIKTDKEEMKATKMEANQENWRPRVWRQIQKT